MSQENVELIQASFAAFARGDLAYLLDASDPDIEVVESPELLPDASTYYGHPGACLMRSTTGAVSGRTSALPSSGIIGVGDQVVSLVHYRARGKMSGAPVELRMAYVHTLKNGRAVRWEVFATWAQALEAAELSE